MLKLYFIRHGETLSNTWHTLQGWSDTPLTANGIMQGKALGKGLADIPFLKAYTSTSERAYDTACYALGKRNLKLIMCRGLKEMNFGTLETKPNSFLGCETYIERVTYDWSSVGGETIDGLTNRMAHTLHEIITLNEDQHGNIMCVSHGLSILAAIRVVNESLYETLLRDETRFGNCCVTVISFENGKFKVEDVNNMTYVEKGLNNEKNYKRSRKLFV